MENRTLGQKCPHTCGGQELTARRGGIAASLPDNVVYPVWSCWCLNVSVGMRLTRCLAPYLGCTPFCFFFNIWEGDGALCMTQWGFAGRRVQAAGGHLLPSCLWCLWGWHRASGWLCPAPGISMPKTKPLGGSTAFNPGCVRINQKKHWFLWSFGECT